jgi:asparagine synthase (glutamine-hydrolysing)
MCGIAGYLGRGDPAVLADMSRRLAHRGPDGEGLWTDDECGVGLAHRRLAIIDTSTSAAQPMASCQGRYQIIFNGEIYNFRQLGAQLSQLGYSFNTASDTAVLGPLYDSFGPAMLLRLNGIFAFAIWDVRERELFLARDAFGVKPLYYSQDTRGVLFASELKALLALPDLDRTINLDAISDYLVHLWTPGERTALRAVAKLRPGHYLRARRGSVDVVQWYSPVREGLTKGRARNWDPANKLAGDLARKFDTAVADQCMSDVPIGAFLSGGIDSSAVVASMVATGNRPHRVYCIGFEGNTLADEGFGNDLEFASRLAADLHLPLSPILVHAPSPDDVEDLAYLLDEPQADLAPMYVGAISKQARADGVKVLLGGVGGDDIFSGYRRHKAAALRARAGLWTELLARCPVGQFASVLPKPLRRRLEKLQYMMGGSDEQFLLRAFEFNPRESALDLLTPEARTLLSPFSDEAFKASLEHSRDLPLVERMLELELCGFLPDHNLNYTDKASMAHGVEVRVPFLDQRLVDFARSVPWQYKTAYFGEKWIFKQSQARRLPREILYRKKTGFGAPLRGWLGGPMRELVEDTVRSPSLQERGLFDRVAVIRLLNDTVSGRRDGAYLLLAVVMIELWMRRFADLSTGEAIWADSNLVP